MTSAVEQEDNEKKKCYGHFSSQGCASFWPEKRKEIKIIVVYAIIWKTFVFKWCSKKLTNNFIAHACQYFAFIAYFSLRTSTKFETLWNELNCSTKKSTIFALLCPSGFFSQPHWHLPKKTKKIKTKPLQPHLNKSTCLMYGDGWKWCHFTKRRSWVGSVTKHTHAHNKKVFLFLIKLDIVFLENDHRHLSLIHTNAPVQCTFTTKTENKRKKVCKISLSLCVCVCVKWKTGNFAYSNIGIEFQKFLDTSVKLHIILSWNVKIKNKVKTNFLHQEIVWTLNVNNLKTQSQVFQTNPSIVSIFFQHTKNLPKQLLNNFFFDKDMLNKKCDYSRRKIGLKMRKCILDIILRHHMKITKTP